MSHSPKKRVTVTVDSPVTIPVGSGSERVVIVVAPEPGCADSVAQGFATQGEPVRVMWFSQGCQALASGMQKALAGVIVCHQAEQTPEADLHALRRAWPDTPVLALQVA
jgi:hypothetical protein